MPTNNEFEAYARKMAEKYGVNPDIFAAQMALESGNWDDAVLYGRRKGGSGEVGAGQFMPGTSSYLQKKWGVNFDPADPYQNLEAAARYMGELQKTFNGDIEKALAAYNAGEGRVGEAQVAVATLRAKNSNGPFNVGSLFSGNDNWKDYIPASTRDDYLKKIIQKDDKGQISAVPSFGSSTPTSASNRTSPGTQGSMVNPDGSLRMPNISDPIYHIQGDTGDSIDYNAYFRDLNAYYQAETARRNMDYGPLSKYVDDVINDYAQQIESGKLSISKARELTANRVSSFKAANDIYASDAFKYGAPAGATSINVPGFSSPIQGGININPLEFALNNIQTGNDMFGAVNVPQVPGVNQIMSGYQGQYGGSAPGGNPNGYVNNNQGPAMPPPSGIGTGPMAASTAAGQGAFALGQMLAGQQQPPPAPPPDMGASVGTYSPSNYDDLARLLASQQGTY